MSAAGHAPGGGNHHAERAATLIAHEAAGFILREAGAGSLITVTRAEPSAHGERVTVFVTVFPDAKERAALSFLERQREAFSDHLKAHTRLSPLPRVDFALDRGEKNRRRLDALS
ncbi:MAG TPA: ribosome-binding factor A [Candidatus Paceibacterota bacterium]|nr:ribosome-binding factor A [Candidatus Paceibacterota bacterium]